jgi:hypothetical protein
MGLYRRFFTLNETEECVDFSYIYIHILIQNYLKDLLHSSRHTPALIVFSTTYIKENGSILVFIIALFLAFTCPFDCFAL